MGRSTRFALLILILCFTCARRASATTYYVAANGSDSNSGTSNSTPWLHAPGMSGCSDTCNSTTPKAGDSIIFRGGDTWHYGNSSATPYIGGTWTWSWAGSSANCQLNAAAGTVLKTSCIYIGVDTTWYNSAVCGGSWCRPILNGDNPLSTSYITTCTHSESGKNFLFFTASYIIFDNFEWTGFCFDTADSGYATFTGGTYGEVSNNYFHGWTISSSILDQNRMITCNGGGCGDGNYILVDHNVFDGSDSSLGTTDQQATGFALGVGTEIAYNIFWHLSNVYIGGKAINGHDNLIYWLFEPSDGSTHGNIYEMQGGQCGTYFYNNLIYITNEAEGPDLYTQAACPIYYFNNIQYLWRVTWVGGVPVSHGDGSECILPENTGGSGSITWYTFNNTWDYPCNFSPKNITLTVNFENNHIIGYSPASLSSLYTGTTVDNGGELFQSESLANGQGYTPSNNYAPTSGSGATVGAGNNMTSLCSSIPNSLAATACTYGYGGVTYNQTNHTAVPNTPTPRPSSGAWDTGAYQFGSGSVSGQPNPPTGLTAVVQ